MTINKMLIFSKIGSDVTDFKHFDYKSHRSMISEICCKRSLHLSSGQTRFFLITSKQACKRKPTLTCVLPDLVAEWLAQLHLCLTLAKVII